MTETDLDEIHALQQQIFPDPWSRESLLAELTPEDHGVAYVVRLRETLVAYCFFSLVAGEAEIRHMAVAPARQRVGVGASLLVHACKELRKRGAEVIYLEVRRSNVAAQHFYEKHGFKGTGERPGYYGIGHEDAIVMRKHLKEGE
jgi:ribosomal-protein-alanine N-acetyltransferase